MFESKKLAANKTPQKKRFKNDYGDNFVAPDGGWGWLVSIAAGISNLCIFPGTQVFGLIYRDKLITLNFTNSQITTIMNTQNACASGSGLLNGPMFRNLTFRKAGMLGALLLSTGLFLSSFAESFGAYMFWYSLIYGFGSGIAVSATSLALNTYFKEKRRRATSFTWTITGLGPFIFPHIVIAILPMLGFQRTVWLFTGISLHAFAAALIYQPVKWHTKIEEEKMITPNEILRDYSNLCTYCQKKIDVSNRKNSKLFSSQYLNSDPNTEIDRNDLSSTLEMPMLTRANDGWFGSRSSLNKTNRIKKYKHLDESLKNQELFIAKTLDQCKDDIKRTASSIVIGISSCTCRNLPQIAEHKTFDDILEDEEEERNNMKWYKKVVVFFDLGLLKDFTFVNLMAGMTLSTFADFNFTVLMPFFLADFGFSRDQIAILMSLIGGADIVMRFLVPFLVENIRWDNRIFFIIAVSGMTAGRFVLAFKPSYQLAIFLFLWIGVFKGLRTIFLALIIPSHVPLSRLPAASGLQLLTSGIFTLSCGPIVGIIRDKTNYTFTLNFLNFISTTTVISWTGELIYRWYQKRKADKEEEFKNEIINNL